MRKNEYISQSQNTFIHIEIHKNIKSLHDPVLIVSPPNKKRPRIHPTMYIKLTTSIMAIYTVTINAAAIGTKQEGIKGIPPETLDRVMEFLLPKTLRDFSQVSRSIRERVTPDVEREQRDLEVRTNPFTFVPAQRLLGLWPNYAQFVNDFPWHNFNNPMRYGRHITIPFPEQMCPGSRCRGIYGGRPALIIQLSEFASSEMARMHNEMTKKRTGGTNGYVAQDTYYLLVRFRADHDYLTGERNYDLAIVTKSLSMIVGQFPFNISWEDRQDVLQKVYRESKDPGAAENTFDLLKSVDAFFF